jgi:hypothetical protein
MSQNEHQNNTTDKDAGTSGKEPQKLDPKGNTTSTKDVPEQGSTVGASQPHQGTWEAPKGGEVVAPPERGQVTKPLEGDEKKTNET